MVEPMQAFWIGFGTGVVVVLILVGCGMLITNMILKTTMKE